MNRPNKKLLFLSGTILCALVIDVPPKLGFSELWDLVPAAGMLLFAILFFWQTSKRTSQPEIANQAVVLAPRAIRKRNFWIMAASLIGGSVGMLPLLPYTVDNFQPWIYYWVIPGQIVFFALFLPFLWKKWTGPEAMIDRRS